MEMDSDTSETNLVIMTKKHRVLLFCKLYWRSLIIVITPIIFLPIAFIGQTQAYPCFFVFLVTAVYWVADVLHPAVISIIPLACYSVFGDGYTMEVHICNELLDCLVIMMLMAAIEYSVVHKRLALKLLVTVGCSHYRLSLVLFFTAMFLSMWLPNTVACGLMMPLVKALLQSLEKMGIVDMYQSMDKTEQKSHKHEMSQPKSTNFTVFYFLGIAYSCSIGGMGTFLGSQTNLIFKEYSEVLFPKLAKIIFPQFMLLTLPGVLLAETLLYIWMNSFFLKVFRAHSTVAIPTGLTEEEGRYIKTLLQNQYTELGRIKFHDIVVVAAVVLTVVLQITTSAMRHERDQYKDIYVHMRVSTPSILCVFVLFVIPKDLEFLKFFRRRNDTIADLLPTAPSKACLNWKMVRDSVMWSVLFTVGGSCMSFEALRHSGMTAEIGRFLLLLQDWPQPVLALAVILCCKLLTELASNSCVANALLPEVARLSIKANVHPHCLMLAATLASSMSAHLVPSTPCIAMVSQYVHIPTWKMMSAGVGPSTITVVVTWFTVTLWSKVILLE